ncbi:MAG: M28 family peptidase [Acidobacteria bacterium]|nr:M28 family peptidase [Acidobacteriota bacterium]
MFRLRVLAPVAVLVISAVGGAVVAPDLLHAQGGRRGRAAAGAERITERQLRADLTFIASDALEGRKTPSAGLDVAAAFIASRLERIGLTPAGDNGTFLQTLALTRRQLDEDGTSLTIGDQRFAAGAGFLPRDAYGSADGGLVYVGNGTVIRSRGVDPYKDVDVRGRFVVSHLGLPVGFSRSDLTGPRGDDWEFTEDAARARGAVGVLYLPDYPTLDAWNATLETRRTRSTVTVDAFASADASVLPSATLSVRAISALFEGERVSSQEVFQRAVRREPAEPFVLSPGKRVHLVVAAKTARVTTSNVVGVFEGGDAQARHEYVALGAHYDHLGVASTPNAAGDAIYNGADDDGSGTVALLAMAEAFASTSPRQRRSLLFVWHTGEESGLWGSRYFTDHPTVPLDRIVAQLNVDVIGRGRDVGSPVPAGALPLTERDSVYVVGSRRISEAFGTLVAESAGPSGVRFDYALDAPDDPADIYRRSDHYLYAKHGIPVAFFFTGLHADYHGLDDEIDRIDFAKLRRVTGAIYGTARTVADTRERFTPARQRAAATLP